MIVRTSNLFPSDFVEDYYHVLDHDYTEYTEYGGRGSCKSSYISIVFIQLILSNKNYNGIAVRRVADTLRDSVYAQLEWAIEQLGVENKIKCTTSPLQMTVKATGQKIFFRGCDDPAKLKSIKCKRGYIAVGWFEESSEFQPSQMRSIRQSIKRGGDRFWIFDSYNPPISKSNWKNKDVLINRPDRFVHKSCYINTPRDWLGDAWLEDAEQLKKTDERLYRHEYLGEPVGNGGNIFENIEVRKITDEEINNKFDWIYNGIDWGFYPDSFAYIKMAYDGEQKILYIFKELYLQKNGNEQASQKCIDAGFEQTDLVTADSAEPKSVRDFSDYGWNIRPAVKGPKSIEAGFKWLQTRARIVIDPERCPHCAAEFSEYEYERDKDGNIIDGYPQNQTDHGMAAVRYAMESVWRRSGM